MQVFQARLAILLLLMWLNLVTSTKLPMYLGEGLSHHVVQQIFFFLMIFFFFDNFFLDDFSFFFFLNFSVWLNLEKDTKLPTYPRKGSSHHVVQKIYIYIYLSVFAKRRAQCVIVGITTNRTRDLSLKGDMGIQPLRHTRNWWHRVGLISPYWYAFKGTGKTSYTLTVL